MFEKISRQEAKAPLKQVHAHLRAQAACGDSGACTTLPPPPASSCPPHHNVPSHPLPPPPARWCPHCCRLRCPTWLTPTGLPPDVIPASLASLTAAPLTPDYELYLLENCWLFPITKELADGAQATLALRACQDAIALNSKRAFVSSSAITAAAGSSSTYARYAMPLYSSMWHASAKPDPRLRVSGCAVPAVRAGGWAD